MLKSLSQLISASVNATDGEIGNVKAAFFDDHSWAIRYLVVDTGKWLPGREVLISPYSVNKLLPDGKNIYVSLTRKQVEGSPDIDTHQPVSRQHERDYSNYYSYPEYWNGGGMWGIGAYPMMSPYLATPQQISENEASRKREHSHDDVHLRSSVKVVGYDIQATDESIGHVTDFVLDDASWAIRYLVVDTRNWWPGGKKVLVATRWINNISWETSTVRVSLTREQIKNSPGYHEALTIERAYEEELHKSYQRNGYWDEAEVRSVTPVGSHSTPQISPSHHAVQTQTPPVYVFNTHAEAEDAIYRLSKAGIDVKKLSLIGKGYHTEEHPIGFYTAGERIRAWGGTGAFWGAMWGLLFAPAVFFIPGVGLLAMAGPVAAMLVGGLEGAVLVGGLSALGAALTQIGMPKDQVMKYETALKADKYLLIVHGDASDTSNVSAVMTSVNTQKNLMSMDAIAV